MRIIVLVLVVQPKVIRNIFLATLHAPWLTYVMYYISFDWKPYTIYMFPEFTWSLVQSQHKKSQNWRSIIILMHMRFHDFSFRFHANVIISQLCQEKKGILKLKCNFQNDFIPLWYYTSTDMTVLRYFIKIWLLKLAQTWLLTSVKRNAHTQRGDIYSVGAFLFLYRHPSFQCQYVV